MEKENGQEAEYRKLTELTKLEHNWAIWENWEGTRAKGGDKSEGQYLLNMQAVAEFNNLIDFWRVWNKLPYSDPGNFFLDVITGKQQQ